MVIPNYDKNNNPNSGYKRLYSFMPKDTFRLLICGNGDSGETNLLCHICDQHFSVTIRFTCTLKILTKISTNP